MVSTSLVTVRRGPLSISHSARFKHVHDRTHSVTSAFDCLCRERVHGDVRLQQQNWIILGGDTDQKLNVAK